MNPNGENGENGEGTEDPGFTSTSDYAKNKTLLVYRRIFKGWANVSKSTLLPLVKTALRGATVTFPSPFRHSVSLTIAASASTLNTDILGAVFHVLVLYRVCWTGHRKAVLHIKGKSFLHSPRLKSNGSACIQPLKIHWCYINGLRKYIKKLRDGDWTGLRASSTLVIIQIPPSDNLCFAFPTM